MSVDRLVVLKAVLTPVLIGAASLAGRRWGDTLGGWLVGLPFTSGPVVFFLCLEHGLRFGAAAAAGVVAGTASQAAFAIAFAFAGRCGWPAGLAAGTAVFAAATAVLDRFSIPLVGALVLVVAALLAGIAAVRTPAATRAGARPPPWDLPMRMAVTTLLVLALTGVAGALGPHLSGLLAPYPLYATVLAVFAHRAAGPAAGAQVMRGLLFGLFGFTGFFLVLSAALERTGLAAAFALAVAVALAGQAVTLSVLKRG